jgi:type I restriction enzyme R subunit
MKLNEDTLVQETTANYLRDALGWQSVFAYNNETFGPEGTLGRKDDTEIVLTRYLGEGLMKLNPGLPQSAYQAAIRELTQATLSQSPVLTNRERYEKLRDGVLVEFRDVKGELKKKRLRVFDFDMPENNHFLVVRELWMKGALYRRRADIIAYVNGIPLVFMELKAPNRDLQRAFNENLADYRDTVPHILEHNAIIILGNGIAAKYGSVSSKYKHFREWKRLDEGDPGVVDMETLLKGLCSKRILLDVFENFILFDDSSGQMIKIVAQNQQVLGVNLAIEAVRNREKNSGKLGVFWHTQGAGKSYSIAFFARKVHRRIGANFTFLVLTDRDDLDTQLYKTFAGCRIVDNDKNPCRASSGVELRSFLEDHNKAYVFSLIQKFNQTVSPDQPYSLRDDIIVVTDEAHRTQYGTLALNMRNALPKASYIGFTGTPLFTNDEITKRIFGGYVSRYGFQRAVEDGATVPLYYDARGEKLNVAISDLNERIATKLEELEIDDIDVAQRLERELKRDYHIITASSRLDRIATDFVEHYSTQWESGKAMFVSIDKITAARMHDLIKTKWAERITILERELPAVADEQDLSFRARQLAWMRETLMAVVISEEQGEVDKFRKWNLDIIQHRKLMKEGYLGADGKRIDIEDAFKSEAHPFRVVFVCAMWLTGFDVPSLATLYLDKPMKAHTLMQAIARANRVNDGKTNGLIVDYCGILKSLRKALATFAGTTDDGTKPGELDPTRPNDELLEGLKEAIAAARRFLTDRGVNLDAIIQFIGFERNAALVRIKEAINTNDENRKRFEIMAREVFAKFKSCLTLKGVNDCRADNSALGLIYKSLQKDREAADISGIMQQLHEVVDAAIVPRSGETVVTGKLFDISAIDFDRLRAEFEKSPAKRTTVINLMDAIEKRLARMMAENPTRTNFQARYEEMVTEYNEEKDRVTIEATFQALLKFVASLGEEESRAVREGLDPEALTLFDLLKKPDLKKAEIERLKTVAASLLETLEARKQEIQDWRAKEATRDAIRQEIYDFLYNDETGLPEVYSADEIAQKSQVVFAHVFSGISTAVVG